MKNKPFGCNCMTNLEITLQLYAVLKNRVFLLVLYAKQLGLLQRNVGRAMVSEM